MDGANVTGSISRRSLESWADATHLSPHDIGEESAQSRIALPCSRPAKERSLNTLYGTADTLRNWVRS